MKSSIENLENSVVKITVEADKEKFAEGLDYAYKQNKGKFNIKGFRKGKVPRKMVENYYGAEVFYEDAFNYVFSKTYPEVIKENNLDVVSRPEIEKVEQIEKGKNLIYTVLVTVKPEIELGEYKGIKYEEKGIRITQKQIDEELEKEQKKNARIVEVKNREVKEGDIVNIDFEGFVDGEAFEGGKAEGHELKIGSNTFIPGFEDQIIGHKKGDEFEVEVTFPEEYQAENLAGKDATFKVKLNSIKEEELPELNDDFAKNISEFDTLDELMEDTKEKIREKREANKRKEKEEEVLSKVVESSTFEIPEVMVDNQVEQMTKNLEHKLKHQGLDLETYLGYTGKTVDEFKESLREDAKKQVSISMVVEKIVEVEDIEATEDEIKEKMEEMAKNYKMNLEDLEKILRPADKENMALDIKYVKAVNFVLDNTEE